MSVGSYQKESSRSGLITLQANPRQLKGFEQFAALVPKAISAARRRAVNKTLRWLRTHIARSVGQQERIAIAAVRQRLLAYPMDSNGQGKLWFGISPIEASRAGRARQTRSGVSVAGRRYQGAFYRKVCGNGPDIWIRAGSKHFTAEDYPDSTVTTRKKGRSGWIAESTSIGRFPLAKAKISLEEVRPHFESWTQKAHQRLLEVMEQELNFELHKLSRRTSNG
ncbi:phage tail protein [Pseudomonas sp. BO3-4]|uniref:phage tail protein n=1 Tax=Pseudomonas sp. BO3-4 TaxID=3094916 RepID=UPI002A5A6BB5|nr:phage tail protein [Pseudomonas sp. BO3-4]WPO31297.1 phage tail protein [Pseudomonas sp. BO3-4]